MDEYMTSSSGAAFNFASWSNAPMLLSRDWKPQAAAQVATK